MIPFFVNGKIKLLHQAAIGWRGTPFMANSNTRGRGVSCQKLVSCLYKECGYGDIEVPNVPMGHAKFARTGESMVEKFMATQPKFPRVEQIAAGDLIGFRIGKVIHHLGIALGPMDGSSGKFVHACFGAGVIFSELSDSTWMTRIAAIWRPII